MHDRRTLPKVNAINVMRSHAIAAFTGGFRIFNWNETGLLQHAIDFQNVGLVFLDLVTGSIAANYDFLGHGVAPEKKGLINGSSIAGARASGNCFLGVSRASGGSGADAASVLLSA
jgi:hypothetical protein